MDHFQLATANKSQETQYPNLSLSAVNALALAQDMPWEDAYRLLLKQGQRYGLLHREHACGCRICPDPRIQVSEELCRTEQPADRSVSADYPCAGHDSSGRNAEQPVLCRPEAAGSRHGISSDIRNAAEINAGITD